MFGFFASTSQNDSLDDLIPTRAPVLVDDVAEPGSEVDMTAFHFIAKSKLGWIAWKESEASLYRLFEWAFDASYVALRVTDSLSEFAIELEIPTAQAPRFSKLFRGQLLAAEIDRIHGLDRSTQKRDVILTSLSSSFGAKHARKDSSLLCLESRLQALDECNYYRQRELQAIQEHFAFIRTDIQEKMYKFQINMHEKVRIACGQKFENMEKNILEAQKEDLECLRND